MTDVQEQRKARKSSLFKRLRNTVGVMKIKPDMQKQMIPKYRFSGHQTFVAHNGWFEKCVNLVVNNSHGFLDDDADGWRLFYDRCCYLLARIGTSSLTPLLRFVQNTDGKWSNAVQVMAYIQQTPMDKWEPLQIREFARNVKGIAEQLKSAWKPFDGTTLLSSSDEKLAASFLSDIHAAVKSRKTGHAALRTALLPRSPNWMKRRCDCE